MNLEDFPPECFKTDAQSLAELEALEIKIAENLGITDYIEDLNYTGTLRESLLFHIYDIVEEDNLIRDWNQRFSWYYACYLKEDHPKEYIELKIFIQLCHYNQDCRFKSMVDKTNIHYQNILNCGKWNGINPLIKYISFGWVVFSLLADISNNNYIDFQDWWSGDLNKVTEYWLNWAKKNGYIK